MAATEAEIGEVGEMAVAAAGVEEEAAGMARPEVGAEVAISGVVEEPAIETIGLVAGVVVVVQAGEVVEAVGTIQVAHGIRLLLLLGSKDRPRERILLLLPLHPRLHLVVLELESLQISWRWRVVVTAAAVRLKESPRHQLTVAIIGTEAGVMEADHRLDGARRLRRPGLIIP